MATAEPYDPLMRAVSYGMPIAAAFLVVFVFRHGWTAPILDTDFWWQLWAGEQMLQGHFPRTNSLSWTSPDTPWVSHEPLVALLYGSVGLKNVGLVKGLLVSSLGVMVTALAWRKDHLWASLATILYVVLLYRFGVSLRALSWGNLFLGSSIYLLFRSEHPRRLEAVAVLVWLWAQVHGSFVLGVGLLLLFDWRYALAAGLSTAINPNGLQLWALVFGYAAGTGSESLVHEHINTWQPLLSTGSRGYTRAVVVLVGGALVFTGKDRRAMVIWLAAAALAFKHQRYVDLVAISTAPFVVDRLAELLPERPTRDIKRMVATAFVAVAVTSPLPTPAPSWYPPGLPEAVPPGARLWNDFRLGGYLGRHGVRVFFDSRNDCYPHDLLADAYVVNMVQPGWREVLDTYQVDTVVTKKAGLHEPLIAEGWEELRRWSEPGAEDFVLLTRPAQP